MLSDSGGPYKITELGDHLFEWISLKSSSPARTVHHMTTTDDRPSNASQASRSDESAAVPKLDVDDFVANAAEFMRRVREGETFAIAGDGELFALVRPQSAVERCMEDFVAKGYADADWARQHEELLEMVAAGPLPPIFDHGWSASSELRKDGEGDQR